jgi:hypothetical protein
MTGEGDPAFPWLVPEEPRDTPQERRLPRPIRTEHRQGFSLLDEKGDLVKGDQVAVGHLDARDLEKGRQARASRPR